MNTEGIIIVLSYPDTIVRPAYTEFSSKIWPFFGVGGKDAVQAGHAALLLINKNNGTVDYYDFGRYITSFGYGRVRSKATDVELEIPIKAKFKKDQLENVEELLIWLDSHPEKTHGEGRLVASVNNAVDYDKALAFIKSLIEQKEIPYGAFVKGGSNCARFVTDTIINSCLKRKIRIKFKASNIFTPSPIGNAIKGASDDEIYMVENKKVSHYNNRSIVKEYRKCFFNKIDIEVNSLGTEFPNTTLFNLEKGTWLGGIGSGAWFKVEEALCEKKYRIARYNYLGEQDFNDVFILENTGFKIEERHQFIHPTNCKEAYLVQNNKHFKFKKN